MTDSDTLIRVLACMDCGTVEPLRDFVGRPDDDQELIAAIAKHESAGIRHTGQLFRDIKESDWGLRERRDEIIKQIQLQLHGGETGLPSSAYTMVETFKDDAMTCFAQHNRNPGCPDYKSPAKRLVPDTASERREMGMDTPNSYDRHEGVPTIYLCNYCPVHSLVQQAARKKAGLYN